MTVVSGTGVQASVATQMHEGNHFERNAHMLQKGVEGVGGVDGVDGEGVRGGGADNMWFGHTHMI